LPWSARFRRMAGLLIQIMWRIVLFQVHWLSKVRWKRKSRAVGHLRICNPSQSILQAALGAMYGVSNARQHVRRRVSRTRSFSDIRTAGATNRVDAANHSRTLCLHLAQIHRQDRAPDPEVVSPPQGTEIDRDREQSISRGLFRLDNIRPEPRTTREVKVSLTIIGAQESDAADIR
jgi:hypothetical protein